MRLADPNTRPPIALAEEVSTSTSVPPRTPSTRPPETSPAPPEVVEGEFLGVVNPAEEERKKLQMQLLLAGLIAVLLAVGGFYIYKGKFQKSK